jgi:hypothetical protein
VSLNLVTTKSVVAIPFSLVLTVVSIPNSSTLICIGLDDIALPSSSTNFTLTTTVSLTCASVGFNVIVNTPDFTIFPVLSLIVLFSPVASTELSPDNYCICVV